MTDFTIFPDQKTKGSVLVASWLRTFLGLLLLAICDVSCLVAAESNGTAWQDSVTYRMPEDAATKGAGDSGCRLAQRTFGGRFWAKCGDSDSCDCLERPNA